MVLRAADGSQFTVGRAQFVDRIDSATEDTTKISVKIEPIALGDMILAQLDTGAPWLVLHSDVAAAMALLDGDGPVVNLTTRSGMVTGRLERTTVNIPADEGDALEVEATAFVSPEWTAGTFLGYSGFLERIRFAIDPQENMFHFGPV
jgi:hypothetical protein